jgi:hypothetical protein
VSQVSKNSLIHVAHEWNVAVGLDLLKLGHRIQGAEGNICTEKEVSGVWRRLHNGELHNLYASPNIIRVIKSKRKRWEGHVTRMGEMRNVYKILDGNSKG